MTVNKVICVVSNFNKDNDARAIINALSCPAFIVDSSGIQKNGFYATDIPFAAGCFNKAVELFLQSDATHALFVCSDVKGNVQAVIDRIETLPPDIGMYSPAVLGRGWLHEKPKKYGLRDVPFCEGMIYGATRDVMKSAYPVDAVKNPHAFGVDIYVAYIASAVLALRVVIDDDINVYHPHGTSYDENRGRADMYHYINSKGPDFTRWFQNNIVNLPYA